MLRPAPLSTVGQKLIRGRLSLFPPRVEQHRLVELSDPKVQTVEVGGNPSAHGPSPYQREALQLLEDTHGHFDVNGTLVATAPVVRLGFKELSDYPNLQERIDGDVAMACEVFSQELGCAALTSLPSHLAQRLCRCWSPYTGAKW